MSRSRNHEKRRRNRYSTAWEARWRDRRDDVRTGVASVRIRGRRRSADKRRASRWPTIEELLWQFQGGAFMCPSPS